MGCGVSESGDCVLLWGRIYSRPRGTGRDPPVDENRLTGYVLARVGRQKDDRTVEVVGLPGSFERYAVDQVFHPLAALVELPGLLCFKPPGGEAVHRDAVPAPFVREAHGELFDPAAARAVGRDPGVPEHTRDRPDVDDPSVSPGNHVRGRRLGSEKGAFQVRVHHGVPIIPRNLDCRFPDIAPRVVHEDVDFAVCLDHLPDHGPDALVVPDIEFDGQRLFSHFVERFLERFERLDDPARNDEVGARPCKCRREVLAQPPAASGDDGDLC